MGGQGIEPNKTIPELDGKLFFVADDLRAILDIMGVFKDTRYLKGLEMTSCVQNII